MGLFRNLKIGVRLGSGFGIVLFLVLVLSAISIGSLKTLSALTVKLYKHPYTVSTAILRIDGNIVRMHRSMKDVALATDAAGIDKAAATVAQYEAQVYKDLDIIYERFLGDKAKVDEAKKLFHDWKPIRDEVIALMHAGARKEAGAITKEKGARHVKAINTSIVGFIDFAQGKADSFLKGAAAKREGALKQLFLCIGVTLVIGGVLAFFLTTGITGPLKAAVKVADRIAEGDLNQEIASGGRDETGMLLSAMKTMSDNLKRMIGELKTGSDTLVDSSSELTDISRKMSASAEAVSERSETVSAASEQMSHNMNSVASAIEQASTNISFVASAAEEMSATIGEISQNSERGRSIALDASQRAEQSSSRVGELGRAADEIGKVTEAISDISEQTNLLALNATIEAARAGEAGKGFAVVAGEIKALASQTAAATSEIRQKIEGIQSSTRLTIEDISGITAVIGDVNDMVSTIAAAVEEQAVTTREIAENVSQASLGMSEVTESVASSSRMADEVTQDIIGVNSSTGEMINNSSQVNTSSEVLEEISVTLKQLVNRFSV